MQNSLVQYLIYGMHFILELCENGTVKVSPEPSKYTAVMKYVIYLYSVDFSRLYSVHV